MGRIRRDGPGREQHDFVRSANISKIDLELIVRAAARIERLAKLHYGTMAFE
jgi:hypothetical protein